MAGRGKATLGESALVLALPTLAMGGTLPAEPDPERAIPRRVALIDQIPKAPPVESPGAMLVVGIILGVLAAALIALAVVKHSWPLGIVGAILLLLVARALRQWHAS